MKYIFDFRNLVAQMIIIIITIVILTSIAVGIPGIWLLYNQLDQQAWAQVEQGRLVTIELYDAQYKEMLDLALLMGQRPTLHNLMIKNEITALSEYLNTLKVGAGLDFILICDSNNQLVAVTGDSTPDSVCQTWKTGIYHQNTSTLLVWMTAHHPIESELGDLGEIFVGRIMDNATMRQLGVQTGLDHILWIHEFPVAASFTERSTSSEVFKRNHVAGREDTQLRSYEIDGILYYAIQIQLDENGVVAEVALDVEEIAKARIRLIVILLSSIFIISIFGSALGVFLARRIGRPLVRLSEAAINFSQGDLETPVQSQSHIKEITQVAKTLESARVDLLATMTSLQGERDWSDHLLASVVEGILTINDAGQITFFSHGAERITGWRKEEVIGRHIDDVFQLEHPMQNITSMIQTSSGDRHKVDIRLKNNQIASLAITRAHLKQSAKNEAKLALVFRDISEEEAIHRLLGQFLANTAHEFRTPLSALEASIELLLDQAPDLKPDELRELHLSLHLGALGLHTLVDNLLESANIEGRRFAVSPRRSDLGQIVAEAAQTMQPLLDKYEQQLTVELPFEIPFVQVDPRRTVQVLINLLSNASRYGPSGEEIILQVNTKMRFARIAVIDRGPGIPNEQKSSIFQRFVYPHANDMVSKAGAGLGLSVVKAIVDAHGGEVGVDNHNGGGSIFWFTLPYAED